jgi:hypothetical protein
VVKTSVLPTLPLGDPPQTPPDLRFLLLFATLRDGYGIGFRAFSTEYCTTPAEIASNVHSFRTASDTSPGTDKSGHTSYPAPSSNHRFDTHLDRTSSPDS